LEHPRASESKIKEKMIPFVMVKKWFDFIIRMILIS
jgi:hypothetical protein